MKPTSLGLGQRVVAVCLENGQSMGHFAERLRIPKGTAQNIRTYHRDAETKGSLSRMEVLKIEECKIDCARRFFAKITSDQVKYDVVNSYGKLMELVK